MTPRSLYCACGKYRSNRSQYCPQCRHDNRMRAQAQRRQRQADVRRSPRPWLDRMETEAYVDRLLALQDAIRKRRRVGWTCA